MPLSTHVEPPLNPMPLSAAKEAVLAAEAAADQTQLEVEIAASRAREDLLSSLARVRSAVGILGEVLDAYRLEDAGLLAEVDRLRAENADLRARLAKRAS